MITMSSEPQRRRGTPRSVIEHASEHLCATIKGTGSLASLGVTARLNAPQFVVRLNA